MFIKAQNWREPFQGHDCAQVFLHYNDENGPFGKTNIYDTRPMLGLPSYFKNSVKTKRYKTNTFIHGTYIPHDLCDELIEYFNFNKKYHTEGAVGRYNNGIIDKNVKESTEILLSKGNFDGVIGEYRNALKTVLVNYLDVFKSANDVFLFDINDILTFKSILLVVVLKHGTWKIRVANMLKIDI